MSSTISLTDLTKYSDNVYEAIVVIAKRAKQINEEQKVQFDFGNEMDDIMGGDDEDEDIEIIEDIERKIIKLPKPTEVAIKEMLSGDIEYDYGFEEDLEDRDN